MLTVPLIAENPVPTVMRPMASVSDRPHVFWSAVRTGA